MTKIILKGKAGQGIKLLSFVLAHVLRDHPYNIALTTEYSPLVRVGKSSAKIIFSNELIENPLIENPDLIYNLTTEKLQKELLKKYDNKKSMNMTLLGKILKEVDIKLDLNNIKKYLPDRFLEQNLEAIKKGYGA